MKNKKGFTLIELLIVVAVIGILASVVLVGLGPIQKQGRDARRISDLRQVQNGLELYYGKNGSYPSGITTWTQLVDALTSANIGISNVPNDPTPSKEYKYTNTPTGYCLGALLEDINNPNWKRSIPCTTNCYDGTNNTPPNGITIGTTLYCVGL